MQYKKMIDFVFGRLNSFKRSLKLDDGFTCGKELINVIITPFCKVKYITITILANAFKKNTIFKIILGRKHKTYSLTQKKKKMKNHFILLQNH